MVYIFPILLLIMEGIGSTSAVLCCFSYQTLVLLQAGSLSEFYDVCKGLELARNFQFPVLREV